MLQAKSVSQLSNLEFHISKELYRNYQPPAGPPITPACCVCQFAGNVCQTKLCFSVLWNPAIIKHFLTALSAFALVPAKVRLYRNSRKVKVRTVCGKVLRFSLSQFSCGRDIKLSLGVALHLNPLIQQNLSTFRGEQVFRWNLETKLGKAFRKSFSNFIRSSSSNSSDLLASCLQNIVETFPEQSSGLQNRNSNVVL